MFFLFFNSVVAEIYIISNRIPQNIFSNSQVIIWAILSCHEIKIALQSECQDWQCTFMMKTTSHSKPFDCKKIKKKMMRRNKMWWTFLELIVSMLYSRKAWRSSTDMLSEYKNLMNCSKGNRIFIVMCPRTKIMCFPFRYMINESFEYSIATFDICCIITLFFVWTFYFCCLRTTLFSTNMFGGYEIRNII